MGLDTTHECWHGPYSFFMAWRVQLHAAITGEPATRESLEAAWKQGRYADQSVPINVLMNHSDCDGEIAADDCLRLAKALEELLPKLPDNDAPEAEYTSRGRAVTFARGLRWAASRRDSVEFR